MIISPPFLPPIGSATEDDWLALAMCGLESNRGAYPLAGNGTWHGGVHLRAPSDGTKTLPVRAIADGVVAYVREPTPPSHDEDDPLNYDAGRRVSGWTSDGCVIIEHNTEIGTGATATVRYFSVCVHLQSLAKTVKQGRAIYRRDELGMAGYIYGEPNLIHFEIICDDANIAKIAGRSDGPLSLLEDGRRDAIFGEIYFLLPPGTKIRGTAPDVHMGHGKHHPAESKPDPQPDSTTDEELVVALRHDGDVFLTTSRVDGTTVGTTLVERDGEHDLFEHAVRDKSCAPSATYELLRFGRIIDEKMTSKTGAHWRKVATPQGVGWVDLSAPAVKKFSDADFPHWRDWRLINGSSAMDNRISASDVRALFSRNDGPPSPPADVQVLIAQPQERSQLGKLICKLPTEWDGSTIEGRWGWLRNASPTNPTALDEEEFARFAAHARKLSFWEEARKQMGDMPGSHWHFHPVEFIRHFRKSGWMSSKEFAQCLPRSGLCGTIAWADALARAEEHSTPINLMLRKYFGHKRHRHIHVLAQIYIETGMLALQLEGGRGQGMPYGPFFGRGYMQLTWPSNYAEYGEFKGVPDATSKTYADSRITSTSTHAWDAGAGVRAWHPRYDPEIVATPAHAAESCGFFWVSKKYRHKNNINRVADLGTSPTKVAFISWLVNGGQNGHSNRQQYAAYLANHFSDAEPIHGSNELRFPALAPTPPRLCATFPPTEIPYTQSVRVCYDRQVP